MSLFQSHILDFFIKKNNDQESKDFSNILINDFNKTKINDKNQINGMNEINGEIDMNELVSPFIEKREYYELYFDGGSRGNPGLCGCGFYIKKGSQDIYHGYKFLSVDGTNNYAEYMGLLNGIDKCLELGVKNLRVYGDSNLVIKQMRGEYQVKNRGLLKLYEKIKSMIKTFDRITFDHVYRDKNKIADELANKAINNYLKKIRNNINE